jgi:hypothetical protein
MQPAHRHGHGDDDKKCAQTENKDAATGQAEGKWLFLAHCLVPNFFIARTQGMVLEGRLTRHNSCSSKNVHAQVMGLSAAPEPKTTAMSHALAIRARNGDAEAFGALIAEQYDAIYRTAWRWCGNRDDAEDIAQDVCVKIGQAIAGFDGRSVFSSWAYRITLNAVRDFQRARTTRGKYAQAYSEISADEHPAEQEALMATQEMCGGASSPRETTRRGFVGLC